MANDLTYYTDGSVKQIGHDTCTSGYGWIQCHPSSARKEFNSFSLLPPKVKLWEFLRFSLLLFITVVAVSIPTQTIVLTLYSHSCIHQLVRVDNPNKKLFNWKLIIWVIKIRNLHVKMTKVKAYTNDKFNEYASQLTKAGANIKDLLLTTNFFRLFFRLDQMARLIRRRSNFRSWSNNAIRAKNL